MKEKYLVVCECNHWEKETWRYCFNINDNDNDCLNTLIRIITKLGNHNNKLFEKWHKPIVCAISGYYFKIMSKEEIEQGIKHDRNTYSDAYKIMNKISLRKLNGAENKILKYINDKSEDENDPFYKGGIFGITLKSGKK